jgi:hypothetical protein
LCWNAGANQIFGYADYEIAGKLLAAENIANEVPATLPREAIAPDALEHQPPIHGKAARRLRLGERTNARSTVVEHAATVKSASCQTGISTLRRSPELAEGTSTPPVGHPIELSSKVTCEATLQRAKGHRGAACLKKRKADSASRDPKQSKQPKHPSRRRAGVVGENRRIRLPERFGFEPKSRGVPSLATRNRRSRLRKRGLRRPNPNPELGPARHELSSRDAIDEVARRLGACGVSPDAPTVEPSERLRCWGGANRLGAIPLSR